MVNTGAQVIPLLPGALCLTQCNPLGSNVDQLKSEPLNISKWTNFTALRPSLQVRIDLPMFLPLTNDLEKNAFHKKSPYSLYIAKFILRRKLPNLILDNVNDKLVTLLTYSNHFFRDP
jgi:hypothetical protein